MPARRITLRIDDLAFGIFDDPAAGPPGGRIEGRFTYGFEVEPAPPIPEPATVTLFATGLGALALRRRAAQRRARRAARIRGSVAGV